MEPGGSIGYPVPIDGRQAGREEVAEIPLQVHLPEGVTPPASARQVSSAAARQSQTATREPSEAVTPAPALRMWRAVSEDPARYVPVPWRSGSTEDSRPLSDDGSAYGHNDKAKEIDVGVDRLYHELKQHQQYGGTPVGHIILRPGEDLATVLWGFVLLIGAFIFFVSSMYAILVSKMMPDTGNVFIDAIKADHYVRSRGTSLFVLSFLAVTLFRPPTVSCV
eukprot:COSAG02_NODE_120_length_35326_cov_39.000823_5_plen_222_part_00